jgi:hypothetical protein
MSCFRRSTALAEQTTPALATDSTIPTLAVGLGDTKDGESIVS